MELNIIRIDRELTRLKKDWGWIAKELKYSRQRVFYWRKTRSIKGAEPIGGLLGIDSKDLIVS